MNEEKIHGIEKIKNGKIFRDGEETEKMLLVMIDQVKLYGADNAEFKMSYISEEEEAALDPENGWVVQFSTIIRRPGVRQ